MKHTVLKSSGMEDGICKLCGERTKLIKSHIIPEFMYENMYDEKHALRLFAAKDIAEGIKKVQYPKSGLYERMLCKRCDNEKLGNFETYASKIIYGGNLDNDSIPTMQIFVDVNGAKFMEIENIDYGKFKLFLLSILWRASVSTLDFFDEVNLGKHEDIIRNMLRSSSPQGVADYPILCLGYANDKRIPEIIAKPIKIKTKTRHTVYSFVINGVIYLFFVNSPQHTLPDFVRYSTINEENKMKILYVPEGHAWDFMIQYLMQ